LGKASVLVPSPNVAEDHQTHNAMALVRRDAAILVKDIDALSDMVPTALDLIGNDDRIAMLEQNILTLALPDSANLIAQEVIKLAKK
jgi:UDP-N-acetylglucosamine--N-acetylmuramyl-(pentapeptide) pyrophosphoryl-undecaprenol N-acetylglucosamine transferase